MQPSQNLINLLKKFEGCSLKAYWDLPGNKGTLTIGYGHTGPDVKEGMTITQAEADNLLLQDLKPRATWLNNYLTINQVILNQNQFDACISIIYNMGQGNFMKSILAQMIIKNPSDKKIPIVWERTAISSKGVVLDGLIKRRKVEAVLYSKV